MVLCEKALSEFERVLNPENPQDSEIPATILGFGEISTIFHIDAGPPVAYKRMPLFSDRASAETYMLQFREYSALLEKAGLNLPKQETFIVHVPDRPVVFYIAQRRFPRDWFGHKLIHRLPKKDIGVLIAAISSEIAKVFLFNQAVKPRFEVALDGQISNWMRIERTRYSRLIYIDTGTPLYRKDGEEQLDPELFLMSAPFFLRWIIRWLFLDDVMNRYYDQRQVYMDLAANLIKEQRTDLVPLAVEIINEHVFEGIQPLTVHEVNKYYRQDKLIWTLFLAFRKTDRWLKTKLIRQRYEFILPGKIKR